MANDSFVTVDQHVESMAKVDARLDVLELCKPVARDLTIPVDGWVQNTANAEYPYQYVMTVEGVTTASRADAILNSASVAVAVECGVCAETETAENSVIFCSRAVPAAALTGTLYVYKRIAAASGES